MASRIRSRLFVAGFVILTSVTTRPLPLGPLATARGSNYDDNFSLFCVGSTVARISSPWMGSPVKKKLTSSPRRSSRNPLVRHFSQYNDEGTVTETELVTPTLRRIRVDSPALATRPYTPGQHVRIEINDPLSLYGILRPSQTLRTYTLWDHSAEEGYFERRVHLYDGEGIGLNWARNVRPGDNVVFWGPWGDFVVTAPPPYLVFVG